ncbi:hypothetical protein BpHYR1_026854 [Brachionus plicatilis]|uniref:Uncharacterized protein n=1 Tax=Brachionus plicatilis TaxID=10195 RepID=A0A3M7S7D8_BRAPC|nr:hypothetical protein BpHYR1_026854 [Brachionus plicatilis]
MRNRLSFQDSLLMQIFSFPKIKIIKILLRAGFRLLMQLEINYNFAATSKKNAISLNKNLLLSIDA